MMSETERRGLDWRWVAFLALAILGFLVPASGSILLSQHVEIERQRDDGQEVRIAKLEADSASMRDRLAPIPILDVKLTLLLEKTDKLEKALTELQATSIRNRAEDRAERKP